MKTKLSPFVYKVKGKKNYLFLDFLNGQLYNISPVGDPHELESQLIELELVIETEGVVPLKFLPNIDIYKTSVILRELQLRISGECHFDCAACGEIGKCKKDSACIEKEMVDLIADQVKYITIETLSIMGGNPLLNMKMVEYIKSKITAGNYRIMCSSPKINELEKVKESLDKMGIAITDSICNIGNISEENMSVNVAEFFFNQEFNPCWGAKLAIDVNGGIKHCMWSGNTLGNVEGITVPNLIFSRQCDELWELTKDKIETCKECEYRYSCSDCRVMTEQDSGSRHSKTFSCSYCPDTGEWT